MLDERTIYNYIDAGPLSVGSLDLGRETFYRLLQVILTDRDSEFSDPVSLEFDKWSEVKTSVSFLRSLALAVVGFQQIDDIPLNSCRTVALG